MRPPADDRTCGELEGRIHEALWRYYGAIYRDALGLRDWERRVRARLDEEHFFGDSTVSRVEDWFGYDFRGKRVLIVGAATGAEFFALVRRGAAVYGIDLNPEAISILRLKARARAVPPTGLVAAAEALPFAENAFDFVYCYTVLEHVANVEQAIDEMIRVCRVSGFVFIHTPDYRFPFEGHYKVPLIPFAPRFAQALYLRLRGRPTRFLKGINFLTVAKLNRILWRRNVITFRAWSPEIAEWRASGNRLMAWYADTFAVQKHQQIFLKKRPAEMLSGRTRRT